MKEASTLSEFLNNYQTLTLLPGAQMTASGFMNVALRAFSLVNGTVMKDRKHLLFFSEESLMAMKQEEEKVPPKISPI